MGGEKHVARDKWCSAFDLFVVSLWVADMFPQRPKLKVVRFYCQHGHYTIFDAEGNPDLKFCMSPDEVDHNESIILCSSVGHYMPVLEKEFRNFD